MSQGKDQVVIRSGTLQLTVDLPRNLAINFMRHFVEHFCRAEDQCPSITDDFSLGDVKSGRVSVPKSWQNGPTMVLGEKCAHVTVNILHTERGVFYKFVTRFAEQNNMEIADQMDRPNS